MCDVRASSGMSAIEPKAFSGMHIGEGVLQVRDATRLSCIGRQAYPIKGIPQITISQNQHHKVGARLRWRHWWPIAREMSGHG